MAELSQIENDGVVYDLKDSTARELARGLWTTLFDFTTEEEVPVTVYHSAKYKEYLYHVDFPALETVYSMANSAFLGTKTAVYYEAGSIANKETAFFVHCQMMAEGLCRFGVFLEAKYTDMGAGIQNAHTLANIIVPVQKAAQYGEPDKYRFHLQDKVPIGVRIRLYAR